MTYSVLIPLSFINFITWPFFWAGLGLVSIPILIHLLNRRGERQPQAEQESAQPRARERRRLGDSTDHASDHAERTQRCGDEHWPVRVTPHCSAPRLSAGTSDTDALALA